MRHLTVISIAAALALSGCSSCDDDTTPSPDAGQDMSTNVDAGPDTQTAEAGSPDTGTAEDAGEGTDSGVVDDAGSTDDMADTNPADVCGDGDITGDEVCDDGNTSADDYCAEDCLSETGRCGDGVLQSAVETCDDGSTTNCTNTRDGGDGTCVAAGTCADGFFDSAGTCTAELVTQHVHIYVANDCSMMVDPQDYTALPGQKVRFDWHNHSQFYPVDVWQSYIGGYTDLATGATWNERHEWCANINAYTGYSDITTNSACPSHRFFINCPGR